MEIRDFGFNELEIGSLYSKWIYSDIKPYIGQRILEIGCGIGTMTKNFEDFQLLIASDINNSYLQFIKEKSKKNNLKFVLLDVTKIGEKTLQKLKNMHIDTVILINVLEHIEQDTLALANINRILSKEGRVILFIPALPSIYGSLDESFGHIRRYTQKDISTKLVRTKFKVEYIKNFNLFGIFWWYIMGKIIRLHKLPKNTGHVLKLVIFFLQKFESVINPPIGQSIIIIGRKKIS